MKAVVNGSMLGFLLTWVALLYCCLIGAAPLASAQSQPSLRLSLPAKHPTLSIKGDIGTICSVQYTDLMAQTNSWTNRTLIRLDGPVQTWSDPTVLATNLCFYRVVSIPPPADTNLVFIQPGTFLMGSPDSELLRATDETLHTVTLTRGFWMSRYLVRQKDYLAVVGSNPSQFVGDTSRPVESVSWYNATNYCWLRTQQEQAAGLIPTNFVYRLPTESEWEYACRAGTTTAFNLGTGLYSGQANFDGQYGYDSSVGQIYNPSGVFLQRTTPVGTYPANAWGLYDMIANVIEWCQDWYAPYPTGSVIDPQGPATGTTKVRRGGYWLVNAQYCRSALRGNGVPTGAFYYWGFRVVLSLAQNS
jgi:formylglycine-generating enzyme required for sulfatase activity